MRTGVCMMCAGPHDQAEDDMEDKTVWWGYCKACDCWTEHPYP